MILYGRYDVHYLIHLKRLMTKDFVRLENPSTSFASSSLQDMISLMNQEDGIEDDTDLLTNPTDENEAETTTKPQQSVFGAKELRMIPGLMSVFTKSQENCLKFWSCTPESPLKNKRFIALATTKGNSFTKSQLNLYKELASWREDVSKEQEFLPGRICSLDFLARVAFHRPLTEDGLRRTQYYLPRFLTNNRYRDALFSRVKDSLNDDNSVVVKKSYPIFENLQKSLAKTKMMNLFSIHNESDNLISKPIFWAISCATISVVIYGFLGDRKRRRSS
mmetsp:Transcript_15948/g.32955  ORF Transcript_15948/g.32955 Transcript_15948/m.32955 type:complete len:277 (-) Transcript_15948:732-1562(-)